MSAEAATLPGAVEDAGEEWVQVDELGMPAPAWSGEAARVVTVGLSELAVKRLVAAGPFEPHEGLDELDGVALAVVSTRAPLVEITRALASLRSAAVPVVALVHTGGETAAVEIMRGGGRGIVAEGNEAALVALLTGEAHDTGLVDSYEQQQTRVRGVGDADRDRDGVTGLPGPRAFRRRLDELLQGGDVPRVACVRVLHLTGGAQRVSAPAVRLVRRRLALQLERLAHAYDADLFTLDDTDFGLLGPDLSPHDAESLGARMEQVAGTFAPSGNLPLEISMGHAGAEVASDLPTLLELAKRAMEVAVTDRRGAVVGADTLALGVSSTTELEAAMRMVAYVEQRDPYAPGHGARVAELAGLLATAVGYEGSPQRRIQLAALLHDVGKVHLPPETIAGPDGLEGELLEAYRSHAVRGADYLRVSAGVDVADAVRAHHERWDGDGFPDGLAGAEIPVAARIIAVADTIDRLRSNGAPDDEAVAGALRERAGAQLDPDLVEQATALLLGVDGSAASLT